MKHSGNKKSELLINDEQVSVFWLKSLRFSVFSSFDPVKDFKTLKFAAQVFLTLRDFGISGILFVFVFDFVKILGTFNRKNFKYYENFKSFRFKDSYTSDVYNYKCVSVFKTSSVFNKLRLLFASSNTDIYSYAMFFEQLFASFDKYSKYIFYTPEYNLSNFENDAARFFSKLEENDFIIENTSNELGFTENLEATFNETVEFLTFRFNKHSDIHAKSNPTFRVRNYVPDIEMLDELKFARLFIKKSIRTRKKLIQKIASQLASVDFSGIPPLEQTDDFIESDDAFYYPLGGINEFTCKGKIESIFPSELAFIDDKLDKVSDSTDLFTLRYVENEVLYFQRDKGYVRRKHYSVNIVLWNFECFCTVIEGLEHTFDVYIESALFHFTQEMIKFVDGKGINLRFHWHIGDKQENIETQELFSHMLFKDEKLGIIENIKHDKKTEIINVLKTEKLPEKWIIIVSDLVDKTNLEKFRELFDFTDKSNIHIIDFREQSSNTDFGKLNESKNLTVIEVPNLKENKNELIIFNEFVKILFNTVI